LLPRPSPAAESGARGGRRRLCVGTAPAFQENGRVAENASCNRYFGSYTWEDGKSRIGDGIGATRMMGAVEALMEQERRLLTILPKAVAATVENGLLVITDKGGKRILAALPNQ
jgi:heat shock protein HslJ